MAVTSIPCVRKARITGFTSLASRTKSPEIAALPWPVGWELMAVGEALHSVQFEETIDRRKQIPVIENAEAGAEDERWDRRPGESKARAEVQRMLRQGGRKPVVVVTQPIVDG